VTILEAVQLVGSVQESLRAGATGPFDRIVPLGNVLQMVEGYLLAAILIIFALGLYEFIHCQDRCGRFIRERATNACHPKRR